ncbi:MAG: UDP-4-amino-4,6-dideoxy-N-acetyl-beta-L-altrosamine transaminase [Lachnospiraceae bacterium]|nr:UDP-4-amino-4,6-dideoxy-N-acetyl-beta-L-altrosamine transaminase [Lachnospiraceae bacterium]
MIPYGRQWIEEDDIEAVVNTLKSDYLTTGPKVAEFEKKVAEYVGAKYAVAVSNGTAALHIACIAAGLSKGDEFITTPITFAASANCGVYVGAKPVFADIDPKTYNISPTEIEKKITDKTKAIIPVHYTGQPCDMDVIHRIAKEHNLIVIEDGAHALGAEYKGRKVGSMSDMTCFSFHPVKHITTGEGGMVTTNDEELYHKLLLARNHGITRNPEEFENTSELKDDLTNANHPGSWYYEQINLGFNYRITDIQCALGITQMNKLDRFLQRRRAIAKRYDEAFAGVKGIITPYVDAAGESAWHLYVIQVPAEYRKEIFEELRKRGIGVNVHYIPVYQHPFYQKNGYRDVCCTESEKLYSNLISIPMYPALTEEEQEIVIKTVLEVVHECFDKYAV